MISVIVPVYGVEKYLDRCVESVLCQTYKDFELLLVDDGSTDDCPRMCDEWAKKDERIRVFHKSNGGLSSARNYGLDKANGEYIAFVDSDDFIHPDYLIFLYFALTQADADIVICNFKLFNDKTEIKIEKEEIQEIKEYDNYTIFEKNDDFLGGACDLKKEVAWNKLYKKEIFSDIRFPEGKIHEDTATYYKFLYSAKKIAYISNRLYFYYENPMGTMRKPFTEARLSSVDFLIEEAEFFKNLSVIDERYSPFVGETYAFTIKLYYSLNVEYKEFDFKGNSKAKALKKQLKRALKKYMPLGCTTLEYYNFYLGKGNPFVKIKYFCYLVKNYFRFKRKCKKGDL